jgi:hypothetical protein
MKLTTKSLDYVMFAGLAVAVLVVERTPELVRLHHKIIDAVAPFSVSGGTAAAFVGHQAVNRRDVRPWRRQFGFIQ